MHARQPAPSGSRRRLVTPLHVLVAANAVSLTGNVITTVAIPWLVLTTTHSPALTGVAVFAGAASAAAGGLVAGRIVDAIGPARTSAAADLLSAAAIAPLPILALLGSLEIWHVMALVMAGTLVDAAGSTARQSLVPAAADRYGQPRERANALFTSGEHLGYLLGAPIAGLLIGALGTTNALWVTVATFAVSATLVAVLVRLPAADPRSAGRAAAGLREAVGFIWRDPALRALVLFPTTATLLIGPLVPIVLPVLAREMFGDPVVLGVMVAAFGVGGLAGAAAFGAVGRRATRRWLYVGVFTVWPLLYGSMALLPPLAVIVGALIVLGVAAGSLVPMQATIRQERSPEHLLPRVVGLSTATIPVVGPISVLITGFLLETLGLRATMLAMTAGTAMIGIAAVLSAGVRAFDRAPTRITVPDMATPAAAVTGA